MTAPCHAPEHSTTPTPGTKPARATSHLIVLVVPVIMLLACLIPIHLMQGTSHLSVAQAWAYLTDLGSASDSTASAVLIESRLPRLIACLAVGAALGLAGAILQSITQNSLASPDTLGVNAGAYFAITLTTAFGLNLPFLSSAGIAFLGGLATAAFVLAISTGPSGSPIRMALAGSVVALGLASLTSILLLFYSWQTQNLFAWGAGTFNQAGISGVAALLPVLGLSVAVLVAVGSQLDVLQLGNDAATSLGVSVWRWQAFFLSVAVVCCAVAVTIAGPIGFVGLCAPALTRLLVRAFPGLTRQRSLVTVSALLGAALLLGSDVLLRAIFGAVAAVSIPTGVLTSLIGAAFLVVLAYHARSGFDTDSLVTMKAGTRIGLAHPIGLIIATALLVLVAVFGSLLVGDVMILGGDVVNWLTDQASTRITIIAETRAPRVLAAALGGIALAIAGTILQAITRNPLADSGVLGISAAAAAGAVSVIVWLESPSFVQVMCGTLVGSLLVGLILAVITGRRGVDHTRLVLTGIGISAGAGAITTVLLVRTDPWNRAKAMTWLGGSTYGATFAHLTPLLLALAVTGLILAFQVRDLDIVQFDDDTPRLLGIGVSRHRGLLAGCALVLVAAATVSVGTIAFLGLVAPHAARMLIGRTHGYLLPLAGLLGAFFLVVADTIGRSVIAPTQLPAGLITSLIGCPYFLWLLWRMRQS